VRRALPVFVRGTAMDDERMTEALTRAGFERGLAGELVELIPTACFRVMTASAGHTFSPVYQRQRADGTRGPEQALTDLPLYVAALEVARGEVSKRQLAAAALRSAEANLTRSLKTSTALVFTPIVFVAPRSPADASGPVPVASSVVATAPGLPAPPPTTGYVTKPEATWSTWRIALGALLVVAGLLAWRLLG